MEETYCTKYIDKIYEFDEKTRLDIAQRNVWLRWKDDFLSGSVAEGAFICRGIQPQPETNYETDIMRPIGEISLQRSTSIIEETQQIGYYRLRCNEELLSCLDTKISELLILNEFEGEYLDGKPMKLYDKMLENREMMGNLPYEEGAPSLASEMNVWGVQKIEQDLVFCIKLTFWPDIVHSWFTRKRYWPNHEAIAEIDQNKCHIVLKKSNDGGTKDQWRLSFSLAEAILSKYKSAFQRKCYMLAKFVYYARVKEHTEEGSGRHLASYLLKTTMLHMLEEMSPQEWAVLEDERKFIEVVSKLFKKLAESLNKGYLSFFFVEEMNLLDGFSEQFLNDMATKIIAICKEWESVEGKHFFHENIKSMYITIRAKEGIGKENDERSRMILEHLKGAWENGEFYGPQNYALNANKSFLDTDLLQRQINIIEETVQNRKGGFDILEDVLGKQKDFASEFVRREGEQIYGNLEMTPEDRQQAVDYHTQMMQGDILPEIEDIKENLLNPIFAKLRYDKMTNIGNIHEKMQDADRLATKFSVEEELRFDPYYEMMEENEAHHYKEQLFQEELRKKLYSSDEDDSESDENDFASIHNMYNLMQKTLSPGIDIQSQQQPPLHPSLPVSANQIPACSFINNPSNYLNTTLFSALGQQQHPSRDTAAGPTSQCPSYTTRPGTTPQYPITATGAVTTFQCPSYTTRPGSTSQYPMYTIGTGPTFQYPTNATGAGSTFQYATYSTGADLECRHPTNGLGPLARKDATNEQKESGCWCTLI